MLNVENLNVHLGDNSYRYSMQIAPGECVAILGESGSGKSTLLNLIGGFLSASGGQLTWQSQDILHLNPADRPVTTLFQDHNLFAHLNLFDNVALGINPGLNLNNSVIDKVKQTLARTGLASLENHIPAQLSGGQSQRAALARCLLRNKPVLLLDEPFSALDEQTRLDMLALTKQVITENKLCTILVTHNSTDAKILATRILRIENGELCDSTL